MADTDKVTINVKPYTGEYPLDLEDKPLTTLEWRWVKKISGYLPLTIGEGFAGSDPDLFIAFAVIALIRHGKIVKEQALLVADRLADHAFDGESIILQLGEIPDEELEGDALPPAPETATGSPKRSSGGSSKPISATPEPTPSPTGTEVLGTPM